ncbi:hypothetical protein [Nonomuraea recticatena]|uniref:Uncharacterized protein n=1 Tax=Nonomuraea recticatena TaxID=46178 RepID=A0ABN3S0J7_9ACTN
MTLRIKRAAPAKSSFSQGNSNCVYVGTRGVGPWVYIWESENGPGTSHGIDWRVMESWLDDVANDRYEPTRLDGDRLMVHIVTDEDGRNWLDRPHGWRPARFETTQENWEAFVAGVKRKEFSRFIREAQDNEEASLKRMAAYKKARQVA